MESINKAIKRSQKIKAIVVEDNAIYQAPKLLKQYFNSSKVFIVADENTMNAVGCKLIDILHSNFEIKSYVFPGKPRPKVNIENAEILKSQLKTHEGVPISVGSGVITDLVKYSAHQLGKPFLAIATAASMDGYASSGVPISIKGFKKTNPCSTAKVIIADLEILANSPVEMTSWGYGDRAGKICAGADWIIADYLRIERITQESWDLVQDRLRNDLTKSNLVKNNDKNVIKELISGLVMVGIASEIHGNTRPASGAEHQIAHLWEMDNVQYQGNPLSHGICVAIGSLTILKIYEWLLKQNLQLLNAKTIVQSRRKLSDLIDEINFKFSSSDIASRAIEATSAKYLKDEYLFERIEFIKQTWANLSKKLSIQLISTEELKNKFEQAGIPINSESVGISKEYLCETLAKARFIRSRYTILDLLEETGLFDQAVNYIYSNN